MRTNSEIQKENPGEGKSARRVDHFQFLLEDTPLVKRFNLQIVFFFFFVEEKKYENIWNFRSQKDSPGKRPTTEGRTPTEWSYLTKKTKQCPSDQKHTIKRSRRIVGEIRNSSNTECFAFAKPKANTYKILKPPTSQNLTMSSIDLFYSILVLPQHLLLFHFSIHFCYKGVIVVD